MLKLWKKSNFKFSILLPIIILIVGFVLRIYNIEQRTFFEADQEWLSIRARDLLRGDLALIGQTTSVGSFSIGPGYIYLQAIFSFVFRGDPVGGVYLSIFLGMATLVGLYLFSRHFVSEKFALLVLVLTSFSSGIITWDQSPWAPSLFYIAQLLILSGAYLVSQKKQIGWLLFCLGAVTGFQSHIGVILSVLSVIIYFLIIKAEKPVKKYLLLSVLIIFIGLLPNLVFDLFNDFVNLKRISAIFGSGEGGYLPFSKVTGAMAYSASAILYPRQVNLLDSFIVRVILAASIANGLSLLFDKKFYKLSLLLLITGILPPALFFIQQGKFSEYYILMSVPSLVFLTSLLVYKMGDRPLLFIPIILLSVILNLQNWTRLERGLSLHDKKQVVAKVVELGGREGYGVSLSTGPGYNFGYNYLFDYYNAKPNIPPLKDQTKIFTIVAPEGYGGINGKLDYGGIGLLWQGI
jgi:4-amino-4-deoxy-L-arabinose transferase-like glycosyltransferase